MCHKFNSQVPVSRFLGLRVGGLKSKGPSYKVLSTNVRGHKVLSSRILSPRSQVLILEYVNFYRAKISLGFNIDLYF